MYFTLEINEQLASAMRAAAEFKVEVEKILPTMQKAYLFSARTLST